jgi:hypothetical protein
LWFVTLPVRDELIPSIFSVRTLSARLLFNNKTLPIRE